MPTHLNLREALETLIRDGGVLSKTSADLYEIAPDDIGLLPGKRFQTQDSVLNAFQNLQKHIVSPDKAMDSLISQYEAFFSRGDLGFSIID